MWMHVRTEKGKREWIYISTICNIITIVMINIIGRHGYSKFLKL